MEKFRGPYKVHCIDGTVYYLEPVSGEVREIILEVPGPRSLGTDLNVTRLAVGQQMQFHNQSGTLKAESAEVIKIDKITQYCDCECTGCWEGTHHCHNESRGCWVET